MRYPTSGPTGKFLFMPVDDVDGPGTTDPRSEDDELITQRWNRALGKMSPEERERLAASIRTSVSGWTEALVANSAFKASMEEMVSQQHRLAQAVSESFPRPLVPSIPAITGLVPPDRFAGVDFSGFEKLRVPINNWVQEQGRIAEVMKGFGEALFRGFPANLRNLPEGGLEQVSHIVCNDGIALYGAPRKEIVIELLAAPNQESRRMILGDRATEISLDCRALLETCSSEWSRPMTTFALEALDSFDAGHAASAQALAASIIDTLLRAFFGEKRSHYMPSGAAATNPRSIEILDTLPFREHFAVSPIWQAHQQFWVEKGDAIPETFNRHASAHAVSNEQYTLINAVQGLLFSSTLLWFLDQEMVRGEMAVDDPADADKSS